MDLKEIAKNYNKNKKQMMIDAVKKNKNYMNNFNLKTQRDFFNVLMCDLWQKKILKLTTSKKTKLKNRQGF